jgi:hypothetical protein
METKTLLFSLLREEIFGSNETTEIPPARWEEIYALASLHDLGHVPASALERKGIAVQDELSQRMFKTQMTALYRYELNCHELKAICRVLTEAQIPHMLLKGSVIRDLYPKPYLRTSCDIDLLVKEEDLERSAVFLEQKLGYVAEKAPAFHDLSLHSKTGVHLELHFNILEHSMPMDGVLSRVWEHAVLREGYTYVQDGAFLLFHTVAHMAYHFSHGGCGIKPFMDLKLLHDQAGFEKEVFSSLCREAGLEEFYEQAYLLAEVWFGKGTHTALTLQMEQYLLRGGVYGSTENHVALERQRAGGKLRYALKRIWMPKEQLKMRYPNMKKSALLIPWYQLRRWVETVCGGRLKHAAGEMKANSRLPETASQVTDSMMKELGL